MSITVTPIPRLTSLTTPAFTLGTANAAGDAITAVASNSTLLAFDATVPSNSPGTAAAGTATVAGRRDHVHGQGAATGNLDLGAYKLVGNGGSTGIAISANGEVTNTAQPAMLVKPAADRENVTGNGTNYTIIWGTPEFDQNDDFDDSATFTAPVTGRYMVAVNGVYSGPIASDQTSLIFKIITTDLTAQMWENPYAIKDAQNGPAGSLMSQLVEMDADDTCTILVDVTGGSQTIDVMTYSFWSIYLVC